VQRRADLDLLAVLDVKVSGDRDRLFLDLAVVADDRDLALATYQLHSNDSGELRHLRGALGRASLEELHHARQTVRDVALGHTTGVEGTHGQLRSGLPDRLRGEQIPLGARIVAVADAYEAMVHGRPYQPAQAHSRVSEELMGLRGAQFDPDLVPIFLAELERDTQGVPPLVALPQIAVLEREAVAGA